LDILRRINLSYLVIAAVAVAVSAGYLASLGTESREGKQTSSNALNQGSAATLPLGQAGLSKDGDSGDYRSFAIFTLPFEENDDSDADGAEAFTVEDYREGMRVMKLHIDSGPSHGCGVSTNQEDCTHNYIIQSIRVITKDGDSDEISQTETSQTEDKSTTRAQEPFEILAGSHKMITVQSLDNITNAVRLSRQYDNVTHILYDIEHWSRTPESEQQNPAESIGRASQRVHAASLKYGITPDATFLVENYRQVDWDNVDFLGMQLQRYSQNITEFSAYVENISIHVKAENPSTNVFVQLSFRFTDAQEMIEAMEAARPWVDGYIVAYLPSSNECMPQCNPAALDFVLKSIRGNAMDNGD
jgi:hypothetical protein